jgi:WXG100 family type VII secretion target
MTANKVRADYDSLKQIAQVFSQQAQATQQTLQQMKQDLDLLQQGDWVGKSADKLYAEMTSAVVPAVTRLQQALESASRITTQISGVMKQAEDDSARVLRGDDGGAGAPAGAGAPQPGGISTGQPVGPSGGSVGGSEGISTGQPVGPSGGSVGGSEGISTGQPVGSSGGSLGGSGTASASGTDTAADRMLAALDPKVAEIAEKSPTLMTQLEQLEKDGWTIVKGTPKAGSFTDSATKTITIDPTDTTAFQVSGVAHEAAHALYGEPPYHKPTRTMTRDQYVQLNVGEQLKGEGNSQFNETLVRDEILTAGGPDVGVSGIKSAEYKQVYADYDAGTITRDQALEKMTGIIADDLTSTTGETNRQYYAKTYEDYWDKHIAPGRKNP